MNKIQNTPTSALQTDFYQLTMSYAYLVSGKAGETTGFESFIRKIKPEISNGNSYYIFDSEEQVKEFMSRLTNELSSGEFFENFWRMISTKIKNPERQYPKIKSIFDSIDKSFEYNVIQNGEKIFPKIPVFQFKGPKIIGQLIETPITNIINGQTGYKTFRVFNEDSGILDILEENMESMNISTYEQYLQERAKEYRQSTSKILLEAGYRRSPNFKIAMAASKIAIENGWDGTSNTALFGDVEDKLINGTMAHAFVMAFEEEEEAFRAWNDIFPTSTILVDTYDTVEAVKKLIKMGIKPSMVRIDSSPLEELCYKVREILDKSGWDDVKIFLSGDITPEMLIKWEEQGVPFDAVMAGTKYVNIGELQKVNPGFVYKVVEYERDGKSFYPYKKKFGESNYPGLKRVVVDDAGDVQVVIGEGWGYENYQSTSNNPKIKLKYEDSINRDKND